MCDLVPCVLVRSLLLPQANLVVVDDDGALVVLVLLVILVVVVDGGAMPTMKAATSGIFSAYFPHQPIGGFVVVVDVV